MSIVVRWQGDESKSLEQATVEVRTEGIFVESCVIVSAAEGAYRYSMSLDAQWRFRSLAVDRVGSSEVLMLRPDLPNWPARAIDVDLKISPMTNSLPIRRLNLPVGGHAEVVVAWVDFPSLEVRPDGQRYTRLSERRFKFESLDSDFTREIEVDGDGLVIDYPGLFHRVA